MTAARKIEPMPVARPAAFVAEMVRAILELRKTNTRRVLAEWKQSALPDRFEQDTRNPLEWWGRLRQSTVGAPIRCPFGAAGDLLWVREAYRLDRDFDGMTPREAQAHCSAHSHGAGAWYEADGVASSMWGRRRAARFMPRWASRITLRVTDVRVERLQEISEADAVAEGCTARTYRDGRGHETATVDFRCLWEAINGKRAPWASNPYVWRVAFERVTEGT